MKIIIISYKHPSEIVLKKLFLDDLSKNTQISFITYKSSLSRLYNATKIKKKVNIKFYSVNNLSQLDIIINKIKPKLILNYFIENLNSEFENLYFFIKKKNYLTAKIIEHPFTWNKYIKIIKNKFTKKRYIYDHGIICSKVAEYSHKYYFYKKKHFFCNMNYVSYKKNRTKINENKKLNLFIDENFAMHPDIKIHKMKNFINPKIYYEELILFFDFFKKILKEKIYIAAHPTTLINHFNKNKLIFQNTLNYVKRSKLVILHHSSAIDYAILSKKNLLFITSDEINKLIDGNTIYRMAKYFGTTPLNLSQKYNSKIIKKKIVLYEHNKRKYDIFIDEFIRHPKFKKNYKIEKIFNKINS